MIVAEAKALECPLIGKKKPKQCDQKNNRNVGAIPSYGNNFYYAEDYDVFTLDLAMTCNALTPVIAVNDPITEAQARVENILSPIQHTTASPNRAAIAAWKIGTDIDLPHKLFALLKLTDKENH